jgi:acylphosphatase
MPGTMKRVRVLVEGTVQGVWFRESTRREAEVHGVTGWVRNLPDGRVEAVFEGPEAGVEAMVQWVHRGPANAKVDRVQAWAEPPSREFAAFTVLRGGAAPA